MRDAYIYIYKYRKTCVFCATCVCVAQKTLPIPTTPQNTNIIMEISNFGVFVCACRAAFWVQAEEKNTLARDTYTPIWNARVHARLLLSGGMSLPVYRVSDIIWRISFLSGIIIYARAPSNFVLRVKMKRKTDAL